MKGKVDSQENVMKEKADLRGCHNETERLWTRKALCKEGLIHKKGFMKERTDLY